MQAIRASGHGLTWRCAPAMTAAKRSGTRLAQASFAVWFSSKESDPMDGAREIGGYFGYNPDSIESRIRLRRRLRPPGCTCSVDRATRSIIDTKLH
jgi:hypothetical protein